MSEVNITPLVDVMLVILIIFMVTAPLLQQGIDVNLPEARGKSLPTEERLDVTIQKDGAIYLNKRLLGMDELSEKMRAVASRADTDVFLRADRDVPYGIVVRVMSIIKEAGIKKLGMVTELAEGK